MKVKEISVSRGRKYSNNYQSVDYHVGITIESDGEYVEDLGDLRDYALTNLMAMETQEEIRCSLVIEEVKAEQIADFKRTYNNVTKKIEKDEKFTKEDIEIKKQPKSTKKIEPNGLYKVSGTKCNKCDGYISWDGYDNSNPSPPIHVTMDGRIIGNGDCPMFDGGG